MKPKIRKGIAYWPTVEIAWEKLTQIKPDIYPEARVIAYELGFAIQVCKSGAYLDEDLNIPKAK